MNLKKTIICFGDSNTYGYSPESSGRYTESERWGALLGKYLGEDYLVIEEGLCGRTTVFEDTLNENLSGISFISPCLMSHNPIDLLIIMLGTNDCKDRFRATSANIANGLKRLVTKAISTPAWGEKQPNILLISPAPIQPECEMTICT